MRAMLRALCVLPFLLLAASAQDDKLFRQICPAPGELRWQKIGWGTPRCSNGSSDS